MSNYVISEEGVMDFIDIFNFGKVKFGYSAAINYLIGLEDVFAKITNNPFIGKKERKSDKTSEAFHIISTSYFIE